MTYFITIKKPLLGVSKISSLLRPPFLLALLGWGRGGLRGVGSCGVGVGGGSGVLAWGSVPVLVLLMGLRLPCLGDGLPFLLSRLGWERRGIQGVFSIMVGFRAGAADLVLRFPWGVLNFGRFCAWGGLPRGVVSVFILWVGVCSFGV